LLLPGTKPQTLLPPLLLLVMSALLSSSLSG